MTYSIFQKGHSALRELPSTCRHLLLQEDVVIGKASKALVLLCAGHLDAAHEVLLGVTFGNLKDAEYAATHRGQTNWTKEHPLEDLDDLIHSIIHRLEGNQLGEGGHSGFDNAEYWAAGGPKAYETVLSSSASSSSSKNDPPPSAIIYQALCDFARHKAPLCVGLGLIADKDTVSHNILADGGQRRRVHVPKGCWDSILFLRLCKQCADDDNENEESLVLQKEIALLQEKEIDLLLQHDLNKHEADGCWRALKIESDSR
jgi:hypothetical protein